MNRIKTSTLSTAETLRRLQSDIPLYNAAIAMPDAMADLPAISAALAMVSDTHFMEVEMPECYSY